MDDLLRWVAVDWGTTHLRVYGLNAQHKVIFQQQTTQGMATLTPEQYEPVLISALQACLPNNQTTPVLACGMVGAKQGWCEAPYLQVPCNLATSLSLTAVHTVDTRIDVRLVAGLSQPKPADVMRGEESQLLGYIASGDRKTDVVCLPGTHSKWVQLKDTEVQHFKTFMTGEVFQILTQHSVLKHVTSGDDWHAQSFTEAVEEGFERPQELLGSSFSLRARALLHDETTAVSRARLSGLLIGSELAGAKPFWQAQSVALIGSDTLALHYSKALQHLGVACAGQDPHAMTLMGLQQFYLKHKNSNAWS